MTWFRRRDQIWRGVYRHFDDVPMHGSGHRSADWTGVLMRALESARTAKLNDILALEHEALITVLRLLVNCKRVVDFGGGSGESYVYVRRLAPELALQWQVVELPAVVEVAKPLLPEVQFAESLAPEHRGADVVFVKSALQYVRDYAAALRALFAVGARVVVLEKFSGVESESYATAQLNVADSTMAYWFISFRELFAIAAEAGYERLLWRRLPRVYDQSNFPPERRMGQASTIIFKRT